MKMDSAPRPALDRPLAGATVADAASFGLISCEADAPLAEIAWQMAHHRVHVLLVVGDGGTAVVADADLLAAVTSGEFDELVAGEVVGTEAVRVGARDPLELAAQKLVEHGITHLLVVDDAGEPVGVLSTLDVARAIAQAS